MFQVIKIEKNYIGVHNFENWKTASKLFEIFVEEAKREEEIDITKAIYLTDNGRIDMSWGCDLLSN